VKFIPNDKWFHALPPCVARVPCGHGEHSVRWHAGTLELLAHPDPEAERVLAALGGEQADCVRIADTWDRHAEDLRVLQIGPRGPADQISLGWDQVPKPGDEAWSFPRRIAAPPAAQPAWAAPGGPGAPPRLWHTPRRVISPRQADADIERLRRELQRNITELVTLLALGPALTIRLSGQVAAAHAARPSAENRPALAAAVQGRLAPLAEQWLGVDPDQVVIMPHQPGEPASVELTGSGAQLRLRVRVPAEWLASVWACGLGLVDRHLVVATVSPGWPDAQVLALPAPARDPVVLDVHGTADATGTPTWTPRP